MKEKKVQINKRLRAKFEDGCIEVRDWDKEDGGSRQYIFLDENELELLFLEYTGLKDKNGVEIYEGDVIQWWNGVTKPQIVEATDGGWNPFIDDCQTDGSWHYKVIGNIYENKELL